MSAGGSLPTALSFTMRQLATGHFASNYRYQETRAERGLENVGKRSSVDEGGAVSLETCMMAQLNTTKPYALAPTLPWSHISWGIKRQESCFFACGNGQHLLTGVTETTILYSGQGSTVIECSSAKFADKSFGIKSNKEKE